MTPRQVDPMGTPPLFDITPGHRDGIAPERVKPARTVGSAMCPRCHKDRATGLIRGGMHLYWRSHTVSTYGSVRVCTASDAPLCQVPPMKAVTPGGALPACPCQAIKTSG